MGPINVARNAHHSVTSTLHLRSIFSININEKLPELHNSIDRAFSYNWQKGHRWFPSPTLIYCYLIPSHQKTIIIIISNVFGIVFISSISSHCTGGEKSIWLGALEGRDEKTKSIIFQSKRLLLPRLLHWIPTLHLFVINRFLVGARALPKIICLLRDFFPFSHFILPFETLLRCRLFIYICGTINSDINKVSLRIICRQISNRSFLCSHFDFPFFSSLLVLVLSCYSEYISCSHIYVICFISQAPLITL